MRKVQLNKIEFNEINVLKDYLCIYFNHKEALLKNISKTNDFQTYVNELLLIDVARTLYFTFGNKIVNNLKSHGKTIVSLKITVTEAVILTHVLDLEYTQESPFEKFVKNKIIALLNKELINIL